MPSELQQAIASIKNGDKETGKQLLVEILKSDPNNETAWLWMIKVVDSNKQRLQCLERVLRINPANEMAKRGVEFFRQEQMSKQERQASTEKPPQSFFVSNPTKKTKRRLPVSRWIFVTLVVALTRPTGVF